MLTPSWKSKKICTLMGCLWPKYITFELTKYRGVIFDDPKFEGKLTCAFKNDMKNLPNFYRLKNYDFILESKMAELNQNKIHI